MKLSTSNCLFSSCCTVTQNSAAIKDAVSKSKLAVIQSINLFCIKTFINSGKGTHIFSENSFTVIFWSITISCFFFKVPEVVACFGFLTTCGCT
jgi:hypothetical protein